MGLWNSILDQNVHVKVDDRLKKFLVILQQHKGSKRPKMVHADPFYYKFLFWAYGIPFETIWSLQGLVIMGERLIKYVVQTWTFKQPKGLKGLNWFAKTLSSRIFNVGPTDFHSRSKTEQIDCFSKCSKLFFSSEGLTWSTQTLSIKTFYIGPMKIHSRPECLCKSGW